MENLEREWTRGLADDERGLVRVTTTHRYKGLPAATVEVLDALPRSDPDWVFMRLLGDTVEGLIEDDRRLFYMACTRAVTRLILVTDGERSPFMEPLEGLLWVEGGWREAPRDGVPGVDGSAAG